MSSGDGERSVPPGEPPPTDNFYSPENATFYEQQPYQPLDSSKREIRLLKVLRDVQSGSLRFTLMPPIPLEQADTYTAISYCAGDPKNTRSLEVNGIQFNAFANLALAIDEICHYRLQVHGDSEPLLWTDQICINQSNPMERSHQVGFMYAIYSHAREVVICLSTQHVDGLAIEWVQHMEWKVTKHSDGPSLTWRKIFEERTAYCMSNINDDRFMRGWVDVVKMIEQPWWRRAWVVQEFAAARDVYFIYGRQSIHWKTLSTSLSQYFQVQELIVSARDFPQNRQLGFLEKRTQQAEDAVSFILTLKRFGLRDFTDLLIHHSCSCEASDQRDRIYAFLGFPNAYGIEPDYRPENSVQAVFTETARRMILGNETIGGLSYAVTARGDLSPTLPSWVPDWTCKRQSSNVSPFGPTISFTGLSRVIPEAEFSDQGKTLEASGIYVGTLTRQVSQNLDPTGYFSTEHKDEFSTTSVATINDQVWILYTAPVPFVLRSSGDGFRLICRAVRSLMGCPFEVDVFHRLIDQVTEDAGWKRIKIY